MALEASMQLQEENQTPMQIDFAPYDPIDKIAQLTRLLTYGEMIELSAGLWKAAGDVEITAKTLPTILHRWAKEQANRPEPFARTGTALVRLD
jgi:hypothetical protein